MNPLEIESFLHELCDAADAVTLPQFRKTMRVNNKDEAGFDPVTVADEGAETAIRAVIEARYPDHGILGEEHAAHNPAARWQWIIDPIDGTRAFISGLPSWGTLIGLYHDGKPVAGMMSQPFTQERFWSAGKGSFARHHANVAALATSAISEISQARVMTTSPFLFSEPERIAYQCVENACLLPRYGFDCYAYAMLAAGNVELVIEAGLKAYDIAALIPVITQAGGIVTRWDGSNAGQGGRILAAANAPLHAQALELLRISG